MDGWMGRSVGGSVDGWMDGWKSHNINEMFTINICRKLFLKEYIVLSLLLLNEVVIPQCPNHLYANRNLRYSKC